jgi:hypothetical protein
LVPRMHVSSSGRGTYSRSSFQSRPTLIDRNVGREAVEIVKE